MPPKLYGTEHIVYIVLFFVVATAVVLVTQFALKTDKSKTVMIKSVAGVLLVMTLYNRIALSVCVLLGKPKNRMYDFLFWLESVGGIACVFYPYFLGQGDSIFFSPTISGLLHHSFGFILCVLLVQCKWFSPSLKQWKMFPIGMCAYTVYGLFLLDVCKMPEAMQIDAPLVAGTPLKWWFVILVGSAILFAYLFCLEKFRKRKTKKAKVQEAKEECVSKDETN